MKCWIKTEGEPKYIERYVYAYMMNTASSWPYDWPMGTYFSGKYLCVLIILVRKNVQSIRKIGEFFVKTMQESCGKSN